MVNVQTEILIRRRRDDVADYAANPDNAPGEPSGFSQLAGLFMAPMISRAAARTCTSSSRSSKPARRPEAIPPSRPVLREQVLRKQVLRKQKGPGTELTSGPGPLLGTSDQIE